MCRCLAHTFLIDSHPLPTRHIHESVRHWALIGSFFSLPYFHFCTSISILRFTDLSVFHLPVPGVAIDLDPWTGDPRTGGYRPRPMDWGPKDWWL